MRRVLLAGHMADARSAHGCREPTQFSIKNAETANDLLSGQQSILVPTQTENWPKAAAKKREEGWKKLPGEVTKEVRITGERADGESARSDAEFVPQFSYNGSDGACHDPEEGEIKV